MDNTVNVKYESYCQSPVASEISFELIEDVKLALVYDNENGMVTMRMSDTISDNVAIEGQLDYDKLCVLVKGLSMMKGQLKIAIDNNNQASGCKSKCGKV